MAAINVTGRGYVKNPWSYVHCSLATANFFILATYFSVTAILALVSLSVLLHSGGTAYVKIDWEFGILFLLRAAAEHKGLLTHMMLASALLALHLWALTISYMSALVSPSAFDRRKGPLWLTYLPLYTSLSMCVYLGYTTFAGNFPRLLWGISNESGHIAVLANELRKLFTVARVYQHVNQSFRPVFLCGFVLFLFDLLVQVYTMLSLSGAVPGLGLPWSKSKSEKME